MRNETLFIDLHRHLDGSVRLQTILELGQQFGLPLPAGTLESLHPHVQVTQPVVGVMAFVAKFEWMQQVMVNTDAVRRIAYENVADAVNEGIDYLELRFSPFFMAEKHGLDLTDVVRAVCEGVTRGAADFPIKVNLIGIMSRTYGVESCHRELDAILSQHAARKSQHSQETSIVGLDLAGDEISFPSRLFVDHFRRARESGLHVTIHAGEVPVGSPHAALALENIRIAIHELGAERLGHAVRAVDDPGLLELIMERNIGIESCLTSNLQTSIVSSLVEHPLNTFLEHDLLVTLNTDDPGISNITLDHEYQVAAREMGLGTDTLRRLHANAQRVAFADLG